MLLLPRRPARSRDADRRRSQPQGRPQGIPDPVATSSVDAARVGVLVAETDVDYWAFHQKLFTSRGQVDEQAALAAAADLGLNRVALELDMNAKVAASIQKSYDIAKALNITGTPTYIIGDEMIPGAIGIDQLREPIANMRALRQAPTATR